MVREALTLEALAALEPGDVAARFIARRSEGLTSSEQQLLTEWLAQDEAHKRAFESAERAWGSFEGSDTDEILSAMREHALAERAQSGNRGRPAAAIAAVFVAAFAALFFIIPGLNPFARPAPEIRYASVRGEVRAVVLPDGSNMTLDADSVVVGHFSATHRSVELRRGRAYFSVMPNASSPFDVAAGGRSVVAVGTRFDVNVVADGLIVTLLEGHVRVAHLGGAQAPVMLEPGQQFVERQGNATVRTIGAGGDNAIAWRDGLVSFDDQPLGEAIAVMNRYSSDQIAVTDAQLASIRISGQFRAGDSQRFADTVAELHNLRAGRRGDQIELSRK